MDTYLIEDDTALVRQEGDTADLEIEVPNILDMTLFDEVKFLAVRRGVNTIEKSLSSGTITVNGQIVHMLFNEEDTKGKAGEHRWEIEASNTTPRRVVTFARGELEIIKERIV